MATYNTITLGTYSSIIDVPAGYSMTDLNDSIEPLMIAQGWAVESTSSNNNYYSRLHIGDVDASYKKGVRILTAVSTMTIYGGEQATGTTLNNSKLSTVDLTTSGCRLYCFIGPAYAMFYARSKDGTTESFSGVFEYTDPLGTAFGPGTSDQSGRVMVITDDNILDSTTSCVDMCSYIDANNTKLTSTSFTKLISTVGSWGSYLNNTAGIALSSTSAPVMESNHAHTGKPYVSDITVMPNMNNDYSCPIGSIYGLKVLNKRAGLALDVISVKTDANGFCNNAGTDQDHFIITGASRGFPEVCFAVPK